MSQKLLEATAARDAQLRAAAGVGVETEAQDCEEIPDVVYIDSYEGSAGGGYPTLPEIYGVDAVDFDQYRAKYLVLLDNNFLLFFLCLFAVHDNLSVHNTYTHFSCTSDDT